MSLVAFAQKRSQKSDAIKMSYKVLLTHSAERDLEAIYDYIAENDTHANANYVLDKLTEVAESLATFPERGSYPKELLALGIREYRQAHFKPYRLIYRVSGKQVIIYIIADGRRDMQTLLTRRMLGV
jgi:toxin ParE1/3/4